MGVLVMPVTITVNKKEIFNAVEKMSENEKLELFEILEQQTIISRARKIKQSLAKNDLTEKDVLEVIKDIRK
jgi:hypothetical protein